VKRFQRFLIRKIADKVKKSINNSDKEELLNLFNSGVIVDLKAAKVKIVEIVERIAIHRGKMKK
jgi:hypothetical protein